MRESFRQYYKQFDFKFKKSSIKELTKELIDSIANSVPKRMSYYNETLGDLYNRNHNKKLKILKTSKLYSKDLELSFDGLQKKFMQIMNDNVKHDSYLKIKSGLVGTKVEVDSIVNSVKEQQEKKEEFEQKHYHDSRKRSIVRLTNNIFFKEDSDINIIHKSNRYEFKLIDFVDIHDNLAYVLTFIPKRSEDIKGKIYINTEDFAVLRIDYENANGIYDKQFNMFGINANHVGYEGTMIFSKNNNDNYCLKYINHRDLQSFKLDRPLTVIEKNKHVKGRRKQNELKLQLLFNLINKTKKEIIVFNSETINTSDFNDITENKSVDVKYFSKYNPDFWKGYNIIEPNQAIKEFTTVE